MSTVAIVSEYNPFHNGHKYHLEKALEYSEADRAIAIMSGNFLQRGVPAITNKYHRAYMAALSGIDAVFELPFVYATSSARDFATSAVIMMNRLQAIDYIAFGAETNDEKALHIAADLIVNEPQSVSEDIRFKLSQGASYPAARYEAYKEYTGDSAISNVMSSPNNILAIEYLAALQKTNSRIKPVIVERFTAGYNSTDISSSICSATAIRNVLISNGAHRLPPNVADVVPKPIYESLLHNYNILYPVFEDDISNILAYSRIFGSNSEEYVDMNTDLINRMSKTCLHTSFSELANMLKSKNLTMTHITRAILHYIFKLKKYDYMKFKDSGYIRYAKLLSLRRESSDILRDINYLSSIPVINKTADGIKQLDDTGKRLFEYDLLATKIYNQMVYEKFGYSLPDDFSQTICII